MQPHKYFYERNLPHYQPAEGTYFITYRLYNSIPKANIERLRNEYEVIKKNGSKMNDGQSMAIHAEYFKKFDSMLDSNLNEPYWLKMPEVMEVVSNSLHFNAAKQYNLWCFSIMPNHVHLLITLLENSSPLYAILQKHKRFTAWQANKILNKTGNFWHHESYDHLVRNPRSFNRIIAYILNNPVKAGFSNTWHEWKGNYLSPEL